MTPIITGLDHLVMTVRSIPETTAFYRDVLGMKVEQFTATDGGTRSALSFGQQKINLHELGSEFLPNALNATSGSADLCFLSDTPLEDWLEHLGLLGVPIEDGPVQRSGATEKIRSVYFRDPDGNLIEVSNRI